MKAFFSLKHLISAGLTMAILGTTVGCTVVGSGYDNQSVYHGDDSYKDRSFNSLSQQLRQDLRRNGYQVMDIKPDNYRGNRTILVNAKKNNQAYELRYSYPNLKLISSNKSNRSNSWREDDYQKNKNYHNKDRYNNKDQHKNRYKNKDNYKNKNQHRNNNRYDHR